MVVCPQIAQIGLVGIPKAFSDGIRAGNAVRHPLVTTLRNYSGSKDFFG
jgi:hypothetical protein